MRPGGTCPRAGLLVPVPRDPSGMGARLATGGYSSGCGPPLEPQSCASRRPCHRRGIRTVSIASARASRVVGSARRDWSSPPLGPGHRPPRGLRGGEKNQPCGTLANCLRAHRGAPPPAGDSAPRTAAFAVGPFSRTRRRGSRRRREARPTQVRHLERIRALLAKAESTEFDEEADAFTSKAQELMTRHAIDDALLAAHEAGRSSGEQPSGRRIGIDDPYAQAKAILLTVIGEASHCRAVWSKRFGFATVFGYAGDLMSVELLYTSLLLQARNAMVRAGDGGKRARSSSFRRSFLFGFADRIGRRLEEAAGAAVADAVDERGSALLPVLAQRSGRVDEFRNEAFPHLAENRMTIGDWSGWVSGVAAADTAVLARGPSIPETASV